jgi:fatty acid CoA ligase FadD9
VLPLLPSLPDYDAPQMPLGGAPASAERFRAAVEEAKIGPDKDIPHITPQAIVKYITNLQLLGLV